MVQEDELSCSHGEGHAAVQGSACRHEWAFLRHIITDTVVSWGSKPRHTQELTSRMMNVFIAFYFIRAIPVQQLSQLNSEVNGLSLRFSAGSPPLPSPQPPSRVLFSKGSQTGLSLPFRLHHSERHTWTAVIVSFILDFPDTLLE